MLQYELGRDISNEGGLDVIIGGGVISNSFRRNKDCKLVGWLLIWLGGFNKSHFTCMANYNLTCTNNSQFTCNPTSHSINTGIVISPARKSSFTCKLNANSPAFKIAIHLHFTLTAGEM